MSRRLNKTSRTRKLTGTAVANLPTPRPDGLEALFARGSARRTALRSSLLVGTALSAGILATMLLDTSPAMAACTTGTITFTGNQTTGIECSLQPASTTIETTDTTNIGPNGFNNGIGLTAGASGLTLGVVTSSDTTIGEPYKAISGDGIFVSSGFNNDTTISINNAALIDVGDHAIFTSNIAIDHGGTATATTSIVNSGNLYSDGRVIVGQAFANADDHAFMTDAFAGTATATVTITDTADKSESEFGRGVYGNSFAKANGHAWEGSGYGGTATATTTITTDPGAIYAAGTVVVGKAGAEATGFGGPGFNGTGGTATATETITNDDKLTSEFGHGIFGGSFADANGRSLGGIATGGTADATTSITNSGNIYSAGRVIIGDAYAKADARAFDGTAFGGTATAGVVITNTADTSESEFGRGIYGDSYAKAKGVAFGGDGTGGDATATTTITNGATGTTEGAITAPDNAIVGYATANAFGGGFGPGNTGTGGTATAGVTITNYGALSTTGLAGIIGEAEADANGRGDTGQGGTANATVSITNSGTISGTTSTNAPLFGIYGKATADANGYGHTGTGGTATATVSITNSTAIASVGPGLGGLTIAEADGHGYTGTGGAANATTTITNSGILTSGEIGIYGDAKAYAAGYGHIGTGGTATAGVTITNQAGGTIGTATTPVPTGISGLSFANADGFGGFGPTSAATGGTATATTSISNAATIDSVDGGIIGSGTAWADGNTGFTATGGTATAGVSISNTGNITVTDNAGISGSSWASANGGFFGDIFFHDVYTAIGGNATATTSIYNAGTINSSSDGIDASALVTASGFGSFAPPGTVVSTGTGGSGTGGDPTATTIIDNVGPMTTGGTGLAGTATTFADGFGFTAQGGTANAYTSITNSGALTAGADGIDGSAAAHADAIGGDTATGGTALGTVTIANLAGGNIISDGDGIAADSLASANAGFAVSPPALFPVPPFVFFPSTVAAGGTATAITSITNYATVKSGDHGIDGGSQAFADAYSAGGSANGGTASATTAITNSGNIYSNGRVIVGDAFAKADAHAFGGNAYGGASSATVTISNNAALSFSAYGRGISGDSNAEANAHAWYGSGTGGTATAYTAINNTGTVTSPWTVIDGDARAEATGFGGGFDIGPYNGSGGTATATVNLTNAGILFSSDGGGIQGETSADADGHGLFFTGTGGTANATTSITNSGTIASTGDGIDGGARATADGRGYTGIGGTANAAVTISNTGTIVSTYDNGIHGFAGAWADGHGHIATGGTATAMTNIYNSGKVTTTASDTTGDLGITGTAIAAASAHGAYGVFGGATAGTATAGVSITNSDTGTINTFDPFSTGISGFAGAFANGDGFMGTGGTATASTTITNDGGIVTHLWGSPGIYAGAVATADGNELNGTGGTATATTSVSNSGTITTYHGWSAGIDAYSGAFTQGFIAEGSATATTTVTNWGTITTNGHNSAGIAAYSVAGGDATATTTVNNSGAVTTNGAFAPGVVASSYAFDAINSATATTTVNNSGTILTTGFNSPAVWAYASAVSVFGTATATITVNNSATGSIIASGYPFHAVAAYGASTTINNAGYIHGNVLLPAFQNTFNNSGLWVMQGDSQFGGNPNTAVNNSGTVTMVVPGSTTQASPDVATAGELFHVVTLNGLETFNNYIGTTGGLVTMINGQPNDRIVISNVSGQQVFFNGGTGDPSRLGVDAFLGGPGATADVLQVGKVTGQGYVTGVTALIVNDTNPGPGAFNPVGIPVAESGGAPNTTVTVNGQELAANVAGNFTSPTINKGLFQYNLFYLPQNATGNPCQAGFNCWFLGETPSTTAFELPRLVTAAQEIWRDTAGTWLDRTADLRDYYFGTGAPLVTKEGPVPAQSFGVGPGVWVRAFGDWGSNNGTANWSAYGQTLSHNVNFNQNTGGVQLGADYPVFNMVNGTLLVGVLGGAVDSTVSFASGTHATFQGGNAGAYATYLNHNFFVDSLFLANLMSLGFNGGGSDGSSVVAGANSNLTQYGGHLDMGYRFQFHPWFIEPEATVEYVHTEFGNMTFPGATAYLDDNAVFGRLGGRIGTTMNVDGYLVEPSITGGVWQNFTGSNFATLASNGYSFDLTDPNSARTIGEFGAMLNIFQRSGWSGFLKGDYYFATGFDDFSLQGGVRYQW